MKTNPLISLITPTYNRKELLEKAILSVVNQKKDIPYQREMLITDDGSTDGTQQYIQKYLDMYPDNIKYFSQENAGVGAARNTCIQHMSSNSDYTILLDSDDELTSDCIFTCLQKRGILKIRGEYDTTLGLYFLCADGKGNIVGSRDILKGQNDRKLTYEDFLDNAITFEMLTLIKSEFFLNHLEFRFPVPGPSDGVSIANTWKYIPEGVFWTKMWQYMHQNLLAFYVCDYIGRLYRVDYGSSIQITKTFSKDKFERSAVANQQILDMIRDDLIKLGYKKTFADYLFRIGINRILYEDKQKGLSFLWKSLCCVFSFKTLIIYMIASFSRKLLFALYKMYI